MMRWIFLFLILSSATFAQMAPWQPVVLRPNAGGGGLAVDAADSTATTVTSGTSVTVTFTVGSGSNRALLAPIMFSQSTLPTGTACTYNSTSMTEITATLESDSNETATSVMYGLLAPASGSHSLTCSWTGNQEAHLTAISFTGVNQGSIAAAFPNGTGINHPGGTASPISVTITSATGHYVVANFAQNCTSFGAVSGTQFGKDDVTGPNLGVVAGYNTGAATVTQTAAFSGTCAQVASGVDVSP